uniref:RING-type domain-containing protein n=1 Tax=Anopheles epiroticus TaxID=199890 RepID=A0A182PKD7_9DIPT
MDIICTICWDSLEQGRIYATPCGHIFHEKCIVNWTMRNPCCPECRQEPTFPLRLILFTWPEQLEAEETNSAVQRAQEGPEEQDRQGDDDRAPKSLSPENMFLADGDSKRYTTGMEVLPESSPTAKKMIDHKDQSDGSDDCGVCSRFHFLLEKGIKLRKSLQDFEKAHRSEPLTEALFSGPAAKRARE